MQKNFSELLLEILTIIDYPKDKNECVKEFEELNHAEAMTNMIERLPSNIQEKIKDTKYNEKEVAKYIDSKEYLSEVIKVSEEALLKLLNDVAATLTEEQKKRIQKLLETSDEEQLQTANKPSR